MPYHPLIVLAGVIIAFVAAFLIIASFSSLNMAIHYINNTINIINNATIQFNNTAQYKYHVSQINFTSTANYIASIITYAAPILLILTVLAYFMYAGRR